MWKVKSGIQLSDLVHIKGNGPPHSRLGSYPGLTRFLESIPSPNVFGSVLSRLLLEFAVYTVHTEGTIFPLIQSCTPNVTSFVH